MKVIRRMFVAFALVAATVTIGMPTATAADSCYGSGCVGLDPANTTCVNDAETIRAINISGYGMLQMRWSKACNAGWARYVNYWRGEMLSNFGITDGVQWAYVSAWTDQGTQGSTGLVNSNLAEGGSSWWGRMVDFGRPEVCIGARLYTGRTTSKGVNDMDDAGWFWGPCVR